uniref:BTB domain-containing protein n=1 Tax=Stomoxys calcitrans TaxID=35570 RepID=A0A1I8P033_STOCA
MDDDQQFCLRWNNHQSTLISVFDTLLENETLVDCTLAAEGKYLKAHKVVLSACSPYFATLLQEQYDKHPIFILKDVKYQELRAMMDYMYRGEVNISQDQLAALLKAAESLQIKGLSDNRSGGGASQPKPDHHRASIPGKLSGGYTLEQTKRARITGAGGPAMDASEIGSREGSSSPSRRRRKVRRRSIENAMTDVHDNSNSSQQPTQSNASGLGAITALAAAAAAVPTTAALASTVVPLSATQQQPQQSSSSAVVPAAPGTTLSSSKKTDNVKGSTQHQQQQQDAMNTDNVQGPAASATPAMDTEATDASAADKSNHKQQKSAATAGASKDTSSVTGSELVIEPKAEYDDEANDENVEDLTLDEEDMGMDDLDHNAGTSQGGEGSSQGYAPWQHDRSQDELLLATQEAQQRDPQDLRTLYNIATAAAAVIAAASSQQQQQQSSSGLNISSNSNLGNSISSNNNSNTSSSNHHSILNCNTTTSNSNNNNNHLLIDNINPPSNNNNLSNIISITNNSNNNNSSNSCSNTKNLNVAATSSSHNISNAPAAASCHNTPRSSHSRNSLDCATTDMYDQELTIHKIYKCCNASAQQQQQQHHSQRCHSQISALNSASSSPLDQVNQNAPSSVICSSSCGTLAGGGGSGLGVVSIETLSGVGGISGGNNTVSASSTSVRHHHSSHHPQHPHQQSTHTHSSLKKTCSSSSSSNCCPSENCNECQLSAAAAAAASYQLANLLGSTMLLPHVSTSKTLPASSAGKLSGMSSSSGVSASAVGGKLKALGVASGSSTSSSLNTSTSSSLNTVPKKVSTTNVFQCEFCTFSCSWKYDLKLHMRQKHGIHNKKM